MKKIHFYDLIETNAEHKMGSKIPGKLRSQRLTCKCDTCALGFKNVQALRSHQAVAHPLKKRIAYRPKTEVIAKRKLIPHKKVIKVAHKMNKTSENASTKKSQPHNLLRKYNTKTPIPSEDGKQSEFECPVCSKIFKVYSWAWKHIQKYHCIDEKGNPVLPTSKDIIKPVRIERCIACNVLIKSDDHTCGISFSNVLKSQYSCLGCNQQFNTLHLYELHIAGLHSEGAENLFFPDEAAFSAWRQDTEKRCDIKYTTLSKIDNMQIYHCSHMKCDSSTASMCPSSFTKQEFSKGIQVVYYKAHYGHIIDEYTLPEEFKKYSISSLLRDTDCYTVLSVDCDSDDLSVQFKRLMDTILGKSLHVKENVLKLLYGKALEMASLLNDEAGCKIECQNGKELAKKTSTDDIVEDESKLDTEMKTKVPVKTYSNTRKNVKFEDNKIGSPKFGSPASLTSFNDSYRHFVEDTLGAVDEKIKKKKMIVKTRIGQFKPTSPTNDRATIKKSPKSSTKVKSSLRLKRDFEYEVIERDKECNIMVIKI